MAGDAKRSVPISFRRRRLEVKVERHSKIVELIGKYEIETQEELAEYLNNAGY